MLQKYRPSTHHLVHVPVGRTCVYIAGVFNNRAKYALARGYRTRLHEHRANVHRETTLSGDQRSTGWGIPLHGNEVLYIKRKRHVASNGQLGWGYLVT